MSAGAGPGPFDDPASGVGGADAGSLGGAESSGTGGGTASGVVAASEGVWGGGSLDSIPANSKAAVEMAEGHPG
jgi:hypothetical protein